MKFTLALLIASEVLDMIWLFINIGAYWNMPTNGTFSTALGGYMKVVIIFTFAALFLKIPIGIFLFHYRKVSPNKTYMLDLPCLKMQLTAGGSNPISDVLKAHLNI